MNKKTYLGHGVYVDFVGYQIKLTTENECGPNNTICLDPNVVKALSNYIEFCYNTPVVEINGLGRLREK